VVHALEGLFVKLGFIGLGAMGRPMVEHLLAAGHEMALWARHPAQAASLLARGATLAETPALLGSQAGVVFTNVTGSADVEALVLGENGLIHGMKPGSILVDFSTIAATTARHVAARLAEKGAAMLDAPVSGGAVGARAATLSIMVGGDAAVLERVRPLLQVLGKTIVHVGSNGAGQVAKACNQMVMVAAIQACAEAARLAAASGIDFVKVREAMQAGSAGSRVLDVFGGRMAERNFVAGVEARLHHKDYAILMDEAARLPVPLPVSATVWQQLNALMAQGWGSDDTATLLRVLEAAGSR
jgi:2-hydroxy-3-oxopropionate reductase